MAMPNKWSWKDQDFIMIAIVGIKDSMRNKVPETIAQLADAGVRVRLISTLSKNVAITAAK